MGWKIENGRPVRESVRTTLSPPEVEIKTEVAVTDFVCPECGREYKTERGLESHLSDKH
jgi:predicted RNA-binding Zn-ribbon protein involved in translation (DUF1610 family)